MAGPGGSDSQESVCNARDLGSILGLGRSTGESPGDPPVLLPGESHGQRSLVGYSPWGCKESDTTERLSLSLLALSVSFQTVEILSHSLLF